MADDVITLSSDSECEILDDTRVEDEKKRNAAVLSCLKADLSQIRSYFPPQKKSAVENEQEESSKAVNGTDARSNSGRPTTTAAAATTKLEPLQVDLEEDNFEVEYGDAEDDEDELQILEDKAVAGSSSSSTKQNGAKVSTTNETIELDNDEEEVVAVEEEEENDDDDDEIEEEDDNRYITQSEELVKAFEIEFAQCRQPGVPKSKIEKAHKKFRDHYSKIKHMSRPVHVRLQEEIQSAIHSLKISPKNYWRIIKDLFDNMDPLRITELAKVPLSERKQVQEIKKQELLRKAEKQLKKLQHVIRKLEQAEVDFDEWDDENDHNSPYILEERAKKKLLEAYYKICDITKCSYLTGRPIQKSIKLKKHNASSGYDEIDSTVEKFVNKGGFLFIPDYTDILTIVKDVTASKGLGLTDGEVAKIAQTVFENVVHIIKKRRQLDLRSSLLSLLRNKDADTEQVKDDDDDVEYKVEDPADVDTELKRKLDENEALKKSEADVIEEFARRAQNQGTQAAEVPEGEAINGSPPPSDSEMGDDDDDDSEGEGDDSSNNKGELVAHELEELMEDEDEEPETVRLNVNVSLEGEEGIDDDETSNEGKPSAVDSESDTNTNVGSVCSNDDTVVKQCQSDNDKAIKRKNSESDENIVETEKIDSNNEIQPPNSKRLKSDENSNESLNEKPSVTT